MPLHLRQSLVSQLGLNIGPIISCSCSILQVFMHTVRPTRYTRAQRQPNSYQCVIYTVSKRPFNTKDAVYVAHFLTRAPKAFRWCGVFPSQQKSNVPFKVQGVESGPKSLHWLAVSVHEELHIVPVACPCKISDRDR